MYRILNKEVSGDMYLNLVKYLCGRCDRISFHIPDYSDFYSGSKNDYDFEKAKTKILNEFPDLFANTLCKYRGYYHSGFWTTNVQSEIYISFISEKVMNNILYRSSDIYDWIGPLFPEDLHFHSNGMCFLSITSHERLTLLYTNNKSDLMNMQNLGLVLSEELTDVSNNIDII